MGDMVVALLVCKQMMETGSSRSRSGMDVDIYGLVSELDNSREVFGGPLTVVDHLPCQSIEGCLLKT